MIKRQCPHWLNVVDFVPEGTASYEHISLPEKLHHISRAPGKDQAALILTAWQTKGNPKGDLAVLQSRRKKSNTTTQCVRKFSVVRALFGISWIFWAWNWYLMIIKRNGIELFKKTPPSQKMAPFLKYHGVEKSMEKLKNHSKSPVGRHRLPGLFHRYSDPVLDFSSSDFVWSVCGFIYWLSAWIWQWLLVCKESWL